ncbi:MAG: hypothetical protein PHX87_03405 [Candidatus Peribacteraceae bacterium]|nr:hypothetical protein [Candidatus Peribacteraceae bacterium]MDD5742453.1 hypothetical protein [Candidatus Peribacteraceae bacterium]
MNSKNVIIRLPDAAGRRILLCTIGVIVALGMPLNGQPAIAAESASFLLYDSFPGTANAAPDASASYLMNENGVTWVAEPVASTHFQILSEYSVLSSSSSSSVEQSSTPSSSAAAFPSAGGHRGHGTALPIPSTSQKSFGGTIPSLRPSFG